MAAEAPSRRSPQKSLCRFVPEELHGQKSYRVYIAEELLALGPARVIAALNEEFHRICIDASGEKFLSREEERLIVHKRHLKDLLSLLALFRDQLPKDNKTLHDFEDVVREVERRTRPT